MSLRRVCSRAASRGWRAPVVVAIVIGACLATVGLAAERPAGASVPETGTYAGQRLPTAELIEKALACNLFGDVLTCFDTPTAAREAAGAAALACAPMVLYDGGLNTSPSLQIFSSGSTNLGAWANRVSSWKTGCKRGRLTDVPTGTVRSRAANTQEVVPASFNNRADAAWRP